MLAGAIQEAAGQTATGSEALRRGIHVPRLRICLKLGQHFSQAARSGHTQLGGRLTCPRECTEYKSGGTRFAATTASGARTLDSATSRLGKANASVSGSFSQNDRF